MKSAVDWLVEQMLEQGYFEKDKPFSFTNLDHLVHQAKELENKNTHIFDTDIQKQSKRYCFKLFKEGFIEGCEWYREQIKNKP